MHCQNLESTHRQLLVSSRSFYKDGQDVTEYAFVIKPQSGTRKICLVGSKGISAVKMIDFITHDKILIKLRGNYWSCMDTSGQIQPIPRTLLKLLNHQPYFNMKTQRIHETNHVKLILKSE